MPRNPHGTRWSAALLVLAASSFAGCGSNTKETTPSTKPVVEQATAPKPDKGPTKLFADWSPAPAGVLIVSGEGNGYLQPCGCADGQLGGFERRYDLFEKLHAQKWPTAAIDSGNLVHHPSSSRGGIEQEKIKFGIALKGLTAMKYDAVALGPEDLKLGVDEVMAQLLNLKEPPRFLSANLIPASGMEEAVRKSTIAKAGEVAIGVTAVMTSEPYNKLVDPAKEALLTYKSPEEVLPAVLADLEKSSQVQVLMVQGPRDEGIKLAKQFPGFDVVVTTAKLPEPADKPEYANDRQDARDRRRPEGQVCRRAGHLPWEPGPGQISAAGAELPIHQGGVDAGPDRRGISEYPQVGRPGDELQPQGERRGRAGGDLRSGRTTARCATPTRSRSGRTPSTPHAYEGLTNDPKRNREYDAECISCHTTGFGLQHRLGLRRADAEPQGQPVRELPRPRLAARLRARQQGDHEVPQAHRRGGRQGRDLLEVPR